MKYLKNYQIFESNTTDESNNEITEVLQHVVDHGYAIKIYDFFYKHSPETETTSGSNELSMNFNSIKDNTKRVKLVKVYNKERESSRFNINDFAKIGFNSSGFTFNSNFSKYREFFLELMDSVSQFSDRNPRLSIVDTDTMLILLEYDVVSQEDLRHQDRIGELYTELRLFLQKEKPKYKYDITYFPQEKHLKITPRGDIDSIYNIISSLCFQMKDTQGYNWMTQDKYIQIPEFVSFRERVNKEGYDITFKSEQSSGQFNDDVVFLIKPK